MVIENSHEKVFVGKSMVIDGRRTFAEGNQWRPKVVMASGQLLKKLSNKIQWFFINGMISKSFNLFVLKVKSMLKGHSKPITGLAFSSLSNLLVFTRADDQIIVWQCNKWISKKSSFLQLPTGRSTKKLSEIEVQFHQDQIHFLVVHELKLAVYETIKLECVVQWPVPKMSAPISHATFSCNSQLVYAAFLDGTVCIFCALDLRP
ncbi:hypothetical protein ACSBR1_037421 [Camellia fascicularis]